MCCTSSIHSRQTGTNSLHSGRKGIVFDREEYSWKDELRELIENAKTHTSNLDTFSAHLEAKGVKS